MNKTAIKKQDFRCSYCGKSAAFSESIGTGHRNHCPFCLRSKHVDLEKSGDRKSKCEKEMKPLGLTFKKEGEDKYGKARQGEIMLIHKCAGCGKISINRIAGDDEPKAILNIFDGSRKLSSKEIEELQKNNIRLLTEKDRQQINTQLFGK